MKRPTGVLPQQGFIILAEPTSCCADASPHQSPRQDARRAHQSIEQLSQAAAHKPQPGKERQVTQQVGVTARPQALPVVALPLVSEAPCGLSLCSLSPASGILCWYAFR
jgi:hypothetical protein